MDSRRVTGAGAGAVKYDILTALTVTGLNGTGGEAVSMARLIAVITARYNWRLDELSMGQREMAMLWGVGDRTVKREVKRWLDAGLMICRRTGVRGRVAAYRLNLPRICEVTLPFWPRVGSDFAERMERLAPGGNRVIRLDTIRATRAAPPSGVTGWEAVSAQLADLFPARHSAWIAPLTAREEGDTLVLEAKSAFAADYVKTHFGRDIAEAVAAEWGRGQTVVIRAPHDARAGQGAKA